MKSRARRTLVRLFVLLAPVMCLAQAPTIGVIDFYGVRSVPAGEIRKVLGTKEGGKLPASKGDIETKLETIPGVVEARLEAACCADGQAILYVGIEEKGSPHFDHRAPPGEEITLPSNIALLYEKFLEAAREAGRSGETGEDLSQGHSLLADPKVRYIQQGFVAVADEHKDILRRVLRNAVDPEQRAIAAYVVGYVKDKASVHDDLQYALRDPDEAVRANALRALAAFTVYAAKNRDSGLKVSPTWLVEMLNSLVWTDRNNAAVALVTLTESRDVNMLGQIRQRALPAVVEMARWKHLPHALPAFILAGRLAGLPEEAIQDAWNKENREPVIKRALSSGKK